MKLQHTTEFIMAGSGKLLLAHSSGCVDVGGGDMFGLAAGGGWFLSLTRCCDRTDANLATATQHGKDNRDHGVFFRLAYLAHVSN